MSHRLAIWLMLLIAVVRCQQQQQQQQRPFDQLDYKIASLTEDCLDCMCREYRGFRCSTDELCGPDGDHDCDLLGIDTAYWLAAGRPTIGTDTRHSEFAALNCRRNPKCSGRAVLGYMARYERDCKRSTVPPMRNCVDYAAVHMYGYDATDCEAVPSERMPPLRRSRFERCLADKVAARQADATMVVGGKLKGGSLTLKAAKAAAAAANVGR